jgi:hypothetical protein
VVAFIKTTINLDATIQNIFQIYVQLDWSKWMQEIIWDRGSCPCCRDMVCCCLNRNNNQRLASIQQNKSNQGPSNRLHF